MRKSRSFTELVFWHIFDHPYCQRGDIGEHFEVSAATVSRTLQTLLEKQLVVETLSRQAAPGRQPRLLAVNPQLAGLLGIEVDLDRVVAAITDLSGTLLGRGAARCDVSAGIEPMLAAARKAADVALADAAISPSELRYLGVGHPGVVDSDGVCVSWANAPGWRHIPMRKALEDAFGLQAAIDDRSRAHALGDRHTSPEDARHPNALYVVAGTGIGMAIFLDGRLFRGSTRGSGEFGHTVIDPAGPLCGCGNRGCVESFASIGAIVQFVNAARPSAGLTMEKIAQAATAGDPLALHAIQRAGSALGVGIANMVQVLNPSLVVLSGRLVRLTGNRLFDAVREAIQKYCLELPSRSVEVRTARVKKDICAVGCAMLAAEPAAARVLRERLSDPFTDGAAWN